MQNSLPLDQTPCSLRIGILVRALLAGKTNLCLECVSIPVKINCQLTSQFPEMLPYFVLAFCMFGGSSSSKTSIGEWESVALGACVASISTFKTSPLIYLWKKNWGQWWDWFLSTGRTILFTLSNNYSVVDAFLKSYKGPHHYAHSHTRVHMPLPQASLPLVF